MPDPILKAETLLADVGRALEESRIGPAMFRNMQKLIADEMPCGEHRLRARLWRRLAARCLKAADKHDAVADRREKTARVVRSFAPPFRQTALEAILRGELSIEGPDADTLLETVPPVESIFDKATCTGCRESFNTPGAFERHAASCPRDSFCAPWGDPENGTWRPLTAVERNTYTIRRRSGWDHTTGDEQRDGRTREPPVWYFRTEEPGAA
jgi:hypothetical protein